MKTIVLRLERGASRVIEVTGVYLKAIARAVLGMYYAPDAEVVLQLDDSASIHSKLRVWFAEAQRMDEPFYFNVTDYLNQNSNIVDISYFYYYEDNVNHTGVIIVKSVEESS